VETPEREKAAPAAADRSLPPEAALGGETEAAAAADRGLPPTAVPADATGEEDVAGAAPAVVAEVSLPAAAPEEVTRKGEGAEEAGGQVADRSPPLAPAPRRRRPAMGVCTAITAMLAVTGACGSETASGLVAHGCADSINRAEAPSLLGPAAYPTTTSRRSAERADVANRVRTEMECRALHEDEEKGGGILPLLLRSWLKANTHLSTQAFWQ